MATALEFIAMIVNPTWAPAWAIIEVPGSNEFFRTGNSVKANTTVDGVVVTSALVPSGHGCHFILLSAALRKKLGNGVVFTRYRQAG